MEYKSAWGVRLKQWHCQVKPFRTFHFAEQLAKNKIAWDINILVQSLQLSLLNNLASLSLQVSPTQALHGITEILLAIRHWVYIYGSGNQPSTG